MNATSAHHAEESCNPAASATQGQQVLVWDAPVRVFHWLMVFCFAGAYVTSESETWRLVHVTLGYTMAGLVAFRLVWGLVGTRYARFSSFVRGPRAVVSYLQTLLSRNPKHHTGHNPAGALAIVAILGLTAVISASGWAAYNDLAGEWVAELHEVVANGMLLLICVHIAGVVVSSWLHKENLARTMVTGRKFGKPGQGIRSAWRSVAAILLASVLGFWYLQWQDTPRVESSNATLAAGQTVKNNHARHDD